jgi:hypothetical protein
MREDLAREFPQVARAASVTWARVRARRPVLWSEAVLWATLSGIGAGFLASDVAEFLAAVAVHILNPLMAGLGFATLLPVVAIAGTAVGAAVSLGVGGPIALALYVAYLGLGVMARLQGLAVFCERAGGGLGPSEPSMCTATDFALPLWPQVVGIGVGLALARAIMTRGAGNNSLLRIAGAYAVALFVVSQVWAAAVAQTASTLTSALTLSAGTAAAAAAAGAVAAQLPGSVRNALIVASVSLLPWVAVHLPLTLQSTGQSLSAESVAVLLIGTLARPIASAILVLSAAVTKRNRFVPRYTRSIGS